MDSNISELVKSGHEIASDLKASCGAVDVRSVAQLISDLASQIEVQLVRSNTLTEENARLSDIAKGGAFVMQKALMKYEFGVGMTMQAEDFIRDARSKTPATDAFLAEVRAAAVDDVFLKISNAIVNCYQDELVGLDMAATICGDFASEIRKGVQS